ncbi:SacI-likey domain-containing protein [Gigaspora margarita]|uniref:SacI-likey domain-containing protein n=1 Tax=Gigaspora margarita TaxID=4874 RepID=A0A8H3WX97_GIGMA|nr:SacI-likey domain-containing protein [Gigaspora margarita]
MVHESLSLYAINDSYILVPYYLDPTILAHTLVINRNTGSLMLSDRESLIPNANTEALTIYGVFGVIKLLSGEYLIVITGRERIGRIGKHDIFQADKFRILPFAKNNHRLSGQQAQDEKRYLSLVESLLKCGAYYFSYTYDLTHSLQRQSQLGDLASKPLWQRADDRFFWNRYLQSKLINFTVNNPDQDLSDFILPVVFGFISIWPAKINNRDIIFSLISRRSRHRAGTRFFSRGIDAEGNVSNFNETEQIVLLDPPADGRTITSLEGKIKLSYVQTRGSVPIFWAQVTNIKYTPRLQIMDTPNMNEAIRRHFDEQTKIYGKQILVNLVNKTGYELPVGDAFEKAVKQLDDPRLTYCHFDFHHECRKMQWDRIQNLIDSIEEDLIQQSYFHSEESENNNVVYKTQSSVVRTNCMDCLDRTNVVQSALAKWMLTQQLRDVGLLSNKERIEEIGDFMDKFRNAWADNADAISCPYSGTPAMKTDYTRTGKRTKQGAAMDLQNAITRYVKNNFMDGPRQDAYDLLMGNYEVEFGTSPFVDSRSFQVKLIPQILVACIIFFLFLYMIPKSELAYLIRLIMVIDFLAITFLIRYIVVHGSDFVSWPSLVPPSYRFYQQWNATPHQKIRKTRRHSDSEHGEKID